MHKVCRLVILSGRAAEKGANKRVRRRGSSTQPRVRFEIALPRGRDFADDVSAPCTPTCPRYPTGRRTNGARGRRPRSAWPRTGAGPPLLETADTQQAALRDGDRAGERGQVVTGDYLRERSGHGPRRLITVRRAQHQDAGVPSRRVRPDVAPGDRAVTGRSASMEGPVRRVPHVYMSPHESLE